MVPDGWKVRTIKDIAKVTSGGTPSRTIPTYWGGNIPWVRTTEVQNCIIYEDDVQEFITDEGLRNSSAKLVPANTILLAMIGQGKTRGQTALLTFEATTNQNCAAIICNNDQEPEFYFNYLLSQYNNIRNLSNSAGQSNLSGGLVKSIKVPVPPLLEQKKIARILSTWDKAIETVEKLIENSQAQKKALMQQLLTGKRRLPGFDGEWENAVVGDCLTESKVHSTNNDPARRLTVRLNLNGIEHRECRGTEAVDATCHFVRSSGQFIYGKQNIHKGAFGIIPDRFNGFETSQDIPCFDFKEQCLPIWLFYLFSRNSFYRGLECLMTGTGSKRLNQKAFLIIKIKLPPLKEQQKIASVLTTADKEIQTLQQKLDCLKQEKKALMQQLLTGKRRVKVEEMA